MLFVSDRSPRLTLHRRGESDGWTALDAEAGQVLELQSIAGRLAVDEVYRGGLEDSAV